MSDLMKAWILKTQERIGTRPLELVELPTPHPRKHEIRVKVNVCGICRTDLHIAEGDLSLKKTPLILGHEIIGVVDEVGERAVRFQKGDKVGISWLGRTCGTCRHCRSGKENYCSDFKATGWDLDGGFAEYAVAHESAVLSVDDVQLPDEEIAPLMCPGVAGHCAFRLTNAVEGDNVGLYGFGPTAYYVLKIARYLGFHVHVSTRSEANIARARENGAVWAGKDGETGMPTPLDAAVVFPPAGPLVEVALKQVKVGGVVVLAPVAMSAIEIKDYSRTFWGRDLRTLYNINIKDAQEFLSLAGKTKLEIGTEIYPLDECQDAMIRLRHGETKQPNVVIRVAR
jgi:propanol-preferring alcohol dehydrogenase